jgi:hypothetical protein
MLYATAAESIETEGKARSKDQSLQNAHIAAHFKCNRKRLWANIDTLVVKDVYTSKYKIAGGRKSITDYSTVVEFTCTTEYKRIPSK